MDGVVADYDMIDYKLHGEEKEWQEASIIKRNYLTINIKDEQSVNIHIDDSHDVLREIDKLDKDITSLHISSILD